MSDPEKATKDQEHTPERYKMKGAPIEVYLTENGEFQCTPAPEACSDKISTQEFLNVLKAMPQDRATVWAKRLDLPETFERCPLLRRDTDLRKQLNDFLADTNPHINTPKTLTQKDGGDKPNGQE